MQIDLLHIRENLVRLINNKFKSLLVLFHDVAWIPAAIYIAFWLRFNLYDIPDNYQAGMLQFIAFALPIHTFAFWFFGCYRGVWRFASLPDLWRILRAVIVGTLVTSITVFLYSRFQGVPRSAIVLYPVLLFIGVTTSRVFYRLVKTHHFSLEKEEHERALVVGAGKAGIFLIRDLLENRQFTPIGLIDDDPLKQGTDLLGIRVVGNIRDLPGLIESLNVQVVLIAMPSAPRSVMDEVVRICAERHMPCRTLPSMLELAQGRIEVARLRPVTVADLLGRDQVRLDKETISSYIEGKCIAITGGGGSIGSELCRQILQHEPLRLLILDSSEFNLYSIENELLQEGSKCQVIPVLADIRLFVVIERVFEQYKPSVVFHAGAYKHVPLLEDNVIEAVRNNILGTKVVVDAAVKANVETFVQVSTDKTVNPTNVMGATKRVAEIYCQSLNDSVMTNFVTTRFGNVLGSAGSVVPLFESQIKAGGPVTVTHADITRFFMTIPEAASLILQAGAMGNGGEIFVLDMGEPVKIRELAEKMIRLSGLEPGKDIHIEYIGLRPGEKMHEELFYKKEKLIGTGHRQLMLANSVSCRKSLLDSELHKLETAVMEFDEVRVLQVIGNLVPEFIRELKVGLYKNASHNMTEPPIKVVK